MSSEPESAAAAFTRAGQDAVTFSRRVAGTALARTERHRDENRELRKEFGKRRPPAGAAPPAALRGAAQRFRRACGLPLPVVPAESAPVPADSPRPGEDEDFSQVRIMREA
ncbi:hypothetical protein ATK36_2648 [Amycolatopsis sulphurea]|uniref:Uncharacterized protein n=1 Tax=Amycolatopsis sulphurea TaxID=76022 RepID=A0A2A9FA07_9PSEU|nr:hypothetical protein [Amycolatopsis sulphurea]PFG47601.1 hypothetical protein ATK36_2648 [Amycolatopsis sulphurea]